MHRLPYALRAGLLGALLLAPVAGARASTAPAPGEGTVTLTGRLEPLGGGSICFATHRVACTESFPGSGDGIEVDTSGLDPFRLEGELLEFDLVPNASSCTTWGISAVRPPAATLVRCGTAAPGCPLRLRVGPSGEIGQWTLWWSSQPGLLPLDGGSVLLGSPRFLAGGLLFGETATFDVVVPGDLSTVGLRLWFQGTRQSIGPVGPLRLTNAECVTLLSPTVPCVLPDC